MNILGYDTKRHTQRKKAAEPTARGSRGVSKSDRKIIENIVGQFKDMSRKDIQKWRQALKMAMHPENPRMQYYHDLVDDLMIDGHLQAQILLRKNATLNTEFLIRSKNGEINEDGTSFLRSAWFYKLLNEMLDSIIKGRKVAQVGDITDEAVELKIIPQRNTVPRLGIVYEDLSRDDTVNYHDEYFDNYIIEMGSDDLGIINNVIPNLIWARNSMQAWAEFCEKFGLPMIAAYTNRTDPETIGRIDFMLSQMAQAARGVFPEGSRLEFKEANRTDAFNVFDKYVERNYSIISEIIVGGTMLTSDGSSRSQSEVHERNLDDKLAKADKRFVKFLVDDKIIPLLIFHGKRFLKDGDRLEFSRSQGLPLDKYWVIVSGIMNTYEVDEEWLAETFDIPITGKKKALTGKIEATASFSSDLFNMPDYPEDNCCKTEPTAAGGKFEKLLGKYHDDLLTDLWHNRKSMGSQARIVAHEALHFIKGLHRGWGKQRLSVAYDATDHLALQMMEFNIFEFAESKTEARMAAMSNLMIDKKNGKIRSFDEFRTEAAKVNKKFNGAWLETEYNLSVAVGQNSAQYMRFMAEKESTTSLVIYQTIGDSSVRATHAALDGLIFSLDDKEAMDLWPPNGHGCRCEKNQYTGNGTAISGKDAKKMMGDGFQGSQFDINRADTRQVFTKKQFYHKTKGLAEKLEDMDYAETYAMDSWSSFRGKLANIILDKTVNAGNVAGLFRTDALKKGRKYMGFEDHLKRKITLAHDTFGKYTSGKYLGESEQRHRLFPHIGDAISNPDEAWLHGHDKKDGSFQLRYVKFYGDRAITVNAEIGDMGLEITEWSNMKKESRIRRGLLIHGGK